MSYRGGSSEHHGMAAVRHWLRALAGRVHAVVDFGIGQGYLGKQARLYVKPRVVVGCDVYEPVLERARQSDIYHRVELASLLDYAKRETTPAGVGVLWMFGDVLEHVPQSDALALLSELKAEFILLRIPVGPYPQRPNKHNPAEEHLWTFYPSMLLDAKINVQHAYISPLRAGLPDFADLNHQEEYTEPRSYIGNFLLRGSHVGG